MRKSSIERLVGARGVSEKNRKEFVAGMGQEMFEAAKSVEVAGEIQKTREQIELCNTVDQRTEEIVAKYGGRNLAITPDHVRITPDPSPGDEECDGRFAPDKQLVLLRPSENDLVFAYKTAHEFLHFKSYGAMQVPLSDELSIDMYYRVGLRLNNRKVDQTFFNALEEGVNETLTKRLIESLKSEIPAFSQVVKNTGTEIISRNLDKNLESDLIYLRADGVGQRYTYVKERESLKTLTDKICARNPDKFENSEQVFEVFARAKFSGNILSLARLIDVTFGTGTLRKIGGAFKGDELKEIVENL